MPRDYSKRGCTTCKRRRKKCDERHPSCVACLRMGLPCEYQTPPTSTRDTTNANALISPVTVVHAMPYFTSTNAAEAIVLSRAPKATLSFYLPSCPEARRDLRLLWQQLWTDTAVRSSTVACFSTVLGNIPQAGELNRVAYGSALCQIRKRLEKPTDDKVDRFALCTAIHFLALMDILGPEGTDDPTWHCRATAPFLRSADTSFDSVTEMSVYVPLLENLIYVTSCLALFTSDLISIRLTWGEMQVLTLMERANPEGPKRIANSPLLVGEYAMYELVLEVTCLYRSHSDAPINDPTIDGLEATLARQAAANEARFATAELPHCTLQQELALREIYRMLGLALRICLTALREETEANVLSVDHLVAEFLLHLAHFPPVEMILVSLAWPVEILACSIRNARDWATYETSVGFFRATLDPGHRQRYEGVLRAARTLCEKNDEGTRPLKFPAGLSLLRKRGGILS